ncbi:DUF2865 domain-containing protein [Mesorhizobium sp. UC22_110]|uniref:DUF2865 domain-containing protein n=1 Tax=Mesorhizobium sp. UC22_110 TaxID=3374552 RepID=UPI003758046C
MNRRQALAWTLVCVIALVFCSLPRAEAASRICRQLRAELASLQKGGGAGQQRRYDGAIARQNNELAKARAQARDAGCGFSLFGGSVSQCAALNTAIDRMNANLDKLQRKRAQMGNASPRRDRSRLLAALETNDCDDKPTQQKQVQADEPDGEVESGAKEAALGAALVPSPSGEFRTMCVRTCDGYFFPMSNAAAVSDFQRDQNRCNAGCPGTEMQVFYSRGMTGDPAAMTSSRTGRPSPNFRQLFSTRVPTSHCRKVAAATQRRISRSSAATRRLHSPEPMLVPASCRRRRTSQISPTIPRRKPMRQVDST